MDVQRRDLHLLMADAAGTAVLATKDGALPILRVELGDGEATVPGARRVIHEAWDVDVPIIEVHVDSDRRREAAGSEPALVVVEAAAVPGARGLCWWSLDRPDPGVGTGLEERLRELLGERRGRRRFRRGGRLGLVRVACQSVRMDRGATRRPWAAIDRPDRAGPSLGAVSIRTTSPSSTGGRSSSTGRTPPLRSTFVGPTLRF